MHRHSRVVIEISCGIASVNHKTEGVELIIINHDNKEEDGKKHEPWILPSEEVII